MSTRLERQGRRNARYIDTQTKKIKKLRPNAPTTIGWTKQKGNGKGPKFVGA